MGQGSEGEGMLLIEQSFPAAASALLGWDQRQEGSPLPSISQLGAQPWS